MEKRNIVEKIKKNLFSKKEIIFGYIHGSFLDNFPFRDVDVALYIDSKKIKKEHAFDYTFQLSLELKKQIGFDIDVQILNYAPLGFRHSVLKNGELLFSRDENLRLDMIENISLEYIDFYELSLQYLRDIVT